MANCAVCGKPFDNEHWFLGQKSEGEPELSVVRNLRCPECWKKLQERPQCRLLFGDEPDVPKNLKIYRVP